MHQSTRNTQVFSMFGGGYVPEQRGIAARIKLEEIK